MGKIYIFRGKAATGKTVLSNMLAQELSIPVLRVDDVVDALRMTESMDISIIKVCYNVVYKIMQTNLDLGTDIILEVGLGNICNFKILFDRFDLRSNIVVQFLIVCSNENEWRRRHEERITSPTPHQLFKSFEQVIQYYKDGDFTPLDHEHIIDTANNVDDCFREILQIVNK